MDKLKMKEIRKQVRFAEIEKERLFNFLKDDLEKLEKDIKENNKENIENFFYYWKQHINDLNK